MQKVKFQIKGMHCNSCATLIEEKLRGRSGVNGAKVSFDSQKAAVLFDETKIKESDISQLVEQAGDYKVEKIEEKEELENSADSPKPRSFLTGILVGASLISISFNIFFMTSLRNQLAAIASNEGNNNQVIAQDDAQNQQVAGVTVQDFNITKADHVRGNFNAPITLVEFSDFECPFCEKHFPTLNKILSDYGDKVRLVYKHFPLPFHPNAQKAAESSECASEQGKFWEYHDKLFENLSLGYGLDNFKQWAKDLNLNSEQFNGCLDSGKYAQKVQADFQEGQEVGVKGTPATFINGNLVSGALPYEAFEQLIGDLLNEKL